MTKRIEYHVYGGNHQPLKTGDWVKRFDEKGIDAFWKVKIDSQNRLSLQNPDHQEGVRGTVMPCTEPERRNVRFLIAYVSAKPDELVDYIESTCKSLAWYEEAIQSPKKRTLGDALNRKKGRYSGRVSGPTTIDELPD